MTGLNRRNPYEIVTSTSMEIIYPEYFTRLEEMTPEKAFTLLERNNLNRTIRDTTVRKYADMMSKDQWVLNGDGICVGKNGDLYNGQHRLWAVVTSGKTVKMQVAYGVDENARPTIDTGITRTWGDSLRMFEGISRGNKMAAIIRMFYCLKHGKSPAMLSPHDGKELYYENKEALDWAHNLFCSSKAEDNSVIAGAFAFAYAYGNNKETRQEIENFAEMVRTGANISVDNPAYILRSSIVHASARSRLRNNNANFDTVQSRYRFALKVLRAIQAFLNNEKLSRNLYATTAGLLYFSPGNPVPAFFN